jgi:hypothetical protein
VSEQHTITTPEGSMAVISSTPGSLIPPISVWMEGRQARMHEFITLRQACELRAALSAAIGDVEAADPPVEAAMNLAGVLEGTQLGHAERGL